MRMHRRSAPVRIAEAELGMALVEFQKKHELTDCELLQILVRQQETVLKYMLRRERHPDDPSKAADEE